MFNFCINQGNANKHSKKPMYMLDQKNVKSVYTKYQ